MEIVKMDQGSPEWHKWRLLHLGSSDSPVIMGESPYKTPYNLWQEKLGLYFQNETQAMTRGKNLEASVLQMFNERMQEEYKPAVGKDSKTSYLSASFDGLCISPLRFKIVEIKCSSRENHELVKKQICPKHWYGQVQKQIYISDVEEAYLCSYFDNVIEIIAIKKNPEYIKKMLVQESTFWQHVLNLEPPMMTEKDYLKRDDKDWLSNAQKYLKTKNIMKRLEEKQKELKTWFQDQYQGTNLEGGGVSLINTVRRGNVDYEKIPEIKNVDLELYRKPSISYLRLL